MSGHSKKQKRWLSQFGMKLIYVKNFFMWLVYNYAGIQTVCENHENIKIENSGIPYENLVYMRCMRENHIKSNSNLAVFMLDMTPKN